MRKKENKEKLYANIYSSSFAYSMIAIAVVACLEVFMLVYTLLNPGLYGALLWTYRAFYMALLAAALLYIGLSLHVKKDLDRRYKLLNTANPIYAVFFFLWALGITFCDFTVTGVVDTTVFMTFSLVIPLGFYVLPQVYALIVAVTDFAMMYMVFLASGGIGQVINTGIFIIFQLVLGVSFLLLKMRLAERIVQEQENAEIDALTGCGNRRAYIREMERLEGEGRSELTYLAIDINGLKAVNDSLGHDAGDKLITGAAECMRRCFGEKGKIYRIGGDEFIVLTPVEELDPVLAEYEKCMKDWSAENRMELSTSCGYVRSAEHPGVGLFELAKMADTKMFEAKAAYYRQSGRERRKR